jgi:hypothetical protein
MSQYTVKVLGLREVTRSLSQYAGAANDLKDANAAIGQKVATQARATTPILTGALQNSVRYNRALRTVQIKAGSARVPYAGVIEYGHPARNIEAQPFLRRAAWDNMEYVRDQYVSNLDSIARQYIGN